MKVVRITCGLSGVDSSCDVRSLRLLLLIMAEGERISGTLAFFLFFFFSLAVPRLFALISAVGATIAASSGNA